MNCEALAEIILDVARGAAVPEQARLGVRRHLDTCVSCAAEYARQRDLTAGLQALSAEAQNWHAPAEMEQRLLAAFAAQQGQEAPVTADASGRRWRYVLAAAAVLTLAVWGIREAARPELQKPRATELARNASGATAAAGGVATAPPGKPASGEAAAVKPATPRPAYAKASASARATADKPAGKPPNPRTANPRTANPRTATSVEFVRIPSAIGLPELESGTVLRMELPLTALPEYGLDIAPDAMRTSVEADILVGQDGQPRAIRLIRRPEAVAQDPRSRQ